MGSSVITVPDRTADAADFITTPSAKEAVLVANTPSFLFDRLRRDSAVQFVIDKMKPSEILEALRKGLATPPSDAVSLVPLYVYLVALASIDPGEREIWAEIRMLDLSHLEWGTAIRNLIFATAVPTITLEFTLASPLKP